MCGLSAELKPGGTDHREHHKTGRHELYVIHDAVIPSPYHAERAKIARGYFTEKEIIGGGNRASSASSRSSGKSDDGACTNQAESYFSRLRRSEFGIHRRIKRTSVAAIRE